MRKLLLLVSFVLLCLYSFTQTNIQQDNRVNPILKRAVSPQSGYNTYGRTGRFINMAVLNQSSHIISWFTCHGRLFDSTRLDDQEFEQVISKQLDPFTLYQNICDKYLADIAAAKDIYRVYGGNQFLERSPGNYQALFAMEGVQAAKTPLQKLMAIENVRKKILTQLAWLNCANPASLHDDPQYRANKEQAGSMIQTKDSTIYYNIDPTSAVTKISLYKRSPEKLYVQNRLGEVIDSVSLLPAKSALLQQEKTDVFLLYRGWLEMQWQEAMRANRINREEYQQVNIREKSYSQLNAIRAKINLLISPEAKCIEQVVYETYRSETSEMYYIPLLGISYNLVQTRGLKEYELANHLGNVLVTLSDRKNGVPSSSNSSLIDHYEPDIVSAQDYYPFGMLQPGRSYLSANGEKYRYGFNGKENDNEVKGEGNQQDYGMRVYDPRLGKFLSVDPITKKYPGLTPYQFASNNPIEGVDLDGLEYLSSKQVRIEVIRGVVKLKVENMTEVVRNALTDYNNDPANWKNGEIGVDMSIGSFSLQQAAPQPQDADINATDNTYGAPDPLFYPGETPVGKPTAKSTGLPDRRYKDRTVNSAPSGGSRGLAIASVAIDLVIIGANMYVRNRIEKDEGLIKRDFGYFKLAAADVNYALSKGWIPKDFQTTERISDIINVVLSGNSYLNSIGDKAGAQILEIGKKIYNTLSVKRNESTGRMIETSRLDGISIKVPERNANYDPQYVKDNPPLSEPPK